MLLSPISTLKFGRSVIDGRFSKPHRKIVKARVAPVIYFIFPVPHRSQLVSSVSEWITRTSSVRGFGSMPQVGN